MMKLYSCALLAGLALLAVSCIEPANEEDKTTTLQKSGKVVFRASLAEPQTKTILSGDENDLSVYWLNGDKLSVFWKGVLSNDFEAQNSDPSTTTDISGTLPTGGTVDDDNYYIVSWRPAGESGGNYYNYNNGKPYLRSWITTGQSKAQENNISTGSLMHAGRSTDFSVQMYNLCGLFRFKITNSDDVRKIVFKGRNNEYISGPIEFEFDENGIPVKIAPDSHVTISDGTKSITLTKDGNAPFEKNTWYYIALTPTEFTKGIRILLYTSTSSGARSITTPLTIARNHCLSSSKLDGALTTDYTPDVDVALTSVSGTTLWPIGTTTITYTLKGPIGNTLTLENLGLTESDVQWVSSDPAVATVENGVVTGVAAGTATITVMGAKDEVTWFSKDITVTVTDAAPAWEDNVSGPFTIAASTTVVFSPGNLLVSGSETTPYQFNNFQGKVLSSWNENGPRDKVKWEEIGTFTLEEGKTTVEEGESAPRFFTIGGKSWRSLSHDEWIYLINTRSAATIGNKANARYVKAIVNGIPGLILFPDNYSHPATPEISLKSINSSGVAFSTNYIQGAEWSAMEEAGAVFLPAAGLHNGTAFSGVFEYGEYQAYDIRSLKEGYIPKNMYRIKFTDSTINTTGSNSVDYYFPARLVCEN